MVCKLPIERDDASRNLAFVGKQPDRLNELIESKPAFKTTEDSHGPKTEDMVILSAPTP